MKSESFVYIYYDVFFVKKVIEKNVYLKRIRHIRQEGHKIWFQCYCSVSMHFRIMLKRIKIIIIIIRTYFPLYIWSKMLSSSQDVLLKLSETTSPHKLFPSKCITLYLLLGDVVLRVSSGLEYLPSNMHDIQGGPDDMHRVVWPGVLQNIKQGVK